MGIDMFMSQRMRGIVAAFALLCATLMALYSPPAAAQLFDEDMFDSSMIKAIRDHDNEALTAQLFSTSPNERTGRGIPAIVVAVESRNLDALRILVEAGARIDNRARRTDRTALTVAAEMGDVAIIRALLELGADADYTGGGREVAFIKAARAGHAEILQALIDAGADTEETDLSGYTAMELAERGRHRQAIEVLRDAGVY